MKEGKDRRERTQGRKEGKERREGKEEKEKDSKGKESERKGRNESKRKRTRKKSANSEGNPASVRDLWCASMFTAWPRDVHWVTDIGDKQKRLHEDYNQIARRSLRLPWRGPSTL